MIDKDREGRLNYISDGASVRISIENSEPVQTATPDFRNEGQVVRVGASCFPDFIYKVLLNELSNY
ncbi:MAG: hypothetical protein WKI04_12345 [Ferruginibacter sp.]